MRRAWGVVEVLGAGVRVKSKIDRSISRTTNKEHGRKKEEVQLVALHAQERLTEVAKDELLEEMLGKNVEAVDVIEEDEEAADMVEAGGRATCVNATGDDAGSDLSARDAAREEAGVGRRGYGR